jgi:hypothetical protein
VIPEFDLANCAVFKVRREAPPPALAGGWSLKTQQRIQLAPQGRPEPSPVDMLGRPGRVAPERTHLRAP